MSTPARFKDKVVVVTGAAQGIGRGVAQAVAEEGAQVLLVDRAGLAYEVQAEIAAAGGQAQAITADLDSAAKGGVNALTASLAFEHADDNIRVNAVATGGTQAPPRKIRATRRRCRSRKPSGTRASSTRLSPAA
ncbi:hypothetical protein ACEQUB_01712 [Ralstonia syzygii]